MLLSRGLTLPEGELEHAEWVMLCKTHGIHRLSASEMQGGKPTRKSRKKGKDKGKAILVGDQDAGQKGKVDEETSESMSEEKAKEVMVTLAAEAEVQEDEPVVAAAAAAASEEKAKKEAMATLAAEAAAQKEAVKAKAATLPPSIRSDVGQAAPESFVRLFHKCGLKPMPGSRVAWRMAVAEVGEGVEAELEEVLLEQRVLPVKGATGPSGSDALEAIDLDQPWHPLDALSVDSHPLEPSHPLEKGASFWEEDPVEAPISALAARQSAMLPSRPVESKPAAPVEDAHTLGSDPTWDPTWKPASMGAVMGSAHEVVGMVAADGMEVSALHILAQAL